MYRILVVDDEPRVSIGIRNFLLGSDLNISCVETALNGFEAIDYIRMDTFDLVLTDIQMSRMNGLELMETIYMEQPGLPVIVISAHEEFDFAKKSLRLGARDYLVKPVEQSELLRTVNKVLIEKEELGKQSLERTIKQQDEGAVRAGRRNELLMELVMERSLSKKDYGDLIDELGVGMTGQYFGVVSIRLDLSNGGFSSLEIRLQDRKLLKYATTNIIEESLRDWNGIVFNGFGNELIGIIQMGDQELSGERMSAQSQLHLIGQVIPMNVKQYLNIDVTVGMSTLHDDVLMLPKLMEEAKAAAEWRKLHPSQKIFYYGDVAEQENINVVEWMTQVDDYILSLKASVDGTSHAEPDRIMYTLTELGQTEELISSYLGMLVYRIYGLLLEYGGGQGSISLRQFDPEVYFRGVSPSGRKSKLPEYMEEAAKAVQLMANERDQSVLVRITSYIREHYRNPALKIQDIASEVHFSTAYLGYLFKREMGKNIWEFVTELRIEEAKHLLMATDKKRYEVAYQVGYESPEHFSRMFKRYLGVSPAEYRKEGQGGVS